VLGVQLAVMLPPLWGLGMALVGSIEGWLGHQVRDSIFVSCWGQERPRIEVVESIRSERVLEDSYCLGKEVEAGGEDPASQVEAVASGVEEVEDHAVLLVGEGGQDLGLLVRPGLPLCRQTNCLGQDRSKEVLVVTNQDSEAGLQFLEDEGCLLELQVHGEGVGFLRRTCQGWLDFPIHTGRSLTYFAFKAKCVCSI
jgi:hypothetical protein